MLDRKAALEELRILEELKLRKGETRWERFRRRLEGARAKGELSVPENLADVIKKSRMLASSADDKIARGERLNAEEQACVERRKELDDIWEEHARIVAQRAERKRAADSAKAEHQGCIYDRGSTGSIADCDA